MSAVEVLGFIGLLLAGVVLFAALLVGMWVLFLKSIPLAARQVRKALEAIDDELEKKP